jgi:hypothetical protein
VELNSTHPRSFIVALIPCRRNRVVSHAKTDVSDCDTGKNRIMISGPKDDGTYVVEFMTAEGEVLAISPPTGFIQPACHPPPSDPPSGPGWIHEIKLDGFRLMRHVRRPALGPNSGHEWPLCYDARP